jgi:hypothetical protein
MKDRPGRTRLVVGFLAGGILAASGLLHSLRGWPELKATFAGTQAPPGRGGGSSHGRSP